MQRQQEAPACPTAEDAALLDGLLTSLNVRLAVFDTELRYVRVNDALATSNRMTPEEHVGRTPMELLPGVQAAVYLPAMRRALAGEAVHGVAIPGSIERGVERHLIASFRPVLEGGEVCGVSVVSVDVTLAQQARRSAARADAALRDSEQRLQAVIDTAADAIVTLDAEWTILSVNPAAERLFGWSTVDLVGRCIDMLVVDQDPDRRGRTPTDAPSTPDWFDLPSLDAGPELTREVLGRHHDGRLLVLELTASPTRLSGGWQTTAFLRDIGERKTFEAQLEQQALHDGLTGLGNRTLLRERLGHALTRLSRSESMLAVLYLDLDNFKHVNDSMGHAAGDHLLVEAARRLSESVRPQDTVVRLGGDEFVVLCEDLAGEDDTLAIAGRIVDALGRPFPLLAGEAFVSASVGVALARDAKVTPDELIQDADAAMYAAKADGKAGVALFDARMQTEAARRASLQMELHHAAARGQLCLVYQPLVDLDRNEVVAVEALLRWKHPTRGLLAPEAFLQLAEETPLIVGLDRWVVATACRQAAAWDRSLGRQLDIWVNLSGRSLSDQTLPADIALACSAVGLDPRRLNLEITENVLMRDTVRTMSCLTALKEHGFRLVVDDFGTGYSSLAYLRRFPVDAVKIDRSFVGGLASDPANQAVVRAVTGLADDLGIASVAEGLETPEELAAATQLRCALGQGFFLGRPADADSIVIAASGAVGLPLDVLEEVPSGVRQRSAR